jgi:hypothetical protein
MIKRRATPASFYELPCSPLELIKNLPSFTPDDGNRSGFGNVVFEMLNAVDHVQNNSHVYRNIYFIKLIFFVFCYLNAFYVTSSLL